MMGNGQGKGKIKQRCEVCEKIFLIFPYEIGRKYCSHKCYWKNVRGEKHFRWNGGKKKDSKGYVLAYSPNHPHCMVDGYVAEHRLIMEAHLGRVLLSTEVVHHINGIRDDNRIENLMLFSSRSEHMKHHKKGGN